MFNLMTITEFIRNVAELLKSSFTAFQESNKISELFILQSLSSLKTECFKTENLFSFG